MKTSDIEEEKRLLEMVGRVLEGEAEIARVLERMYRVIKPVFDPCITGKENLPERPVLMVGNHAQFALDVPLIVASMQVECGRSIMGMADKMLFANLRLARVFNRLGSVEGNPVVCSALMENGSDLLVFPGGAHEVNKPASAMYELKWKERTGFVRLAAQHGYTILPFATIGPEEFYGRYMEGDELASSWVGKLLNRTGVLDFEARPDLKIPLIRGLFGTTLPKPQRFYMSIGEPLDLGAHKGKKLSKPALLKIRDQAADSINTQVRELLLIRAQQSSKDSWWRRWLI